MLRPLALCLPIALIACGGTSTGNSDAADAVDASTTTDGTTPRDDGTPPVDAVVPVDATATDSGVPVTDTGVATDSGTATDSGQAMVIPMEVTFYGWADNDPPSAQIAYPGTLHDMAGGTGTYVDPITVATDPTEFAPGTRLYIPFIEKYVIMEDTCAECITDWAATPHRFHIDVWMNSDDTHASQLIACEDQWTQATTNVEVNPPPGRTVTTAPLFDPSTGTCRTTP